MIKPIHAILVVMSVVVSACASPKYNYQPEATEISSPPLGETSTAGVGEAMLEQGKYVEKDSVHFPQDIVVGALGTYTFSVGYYSKVGDDKDSEYFLPEKSADGGNVTKGLLTDPFQAIQIMSASDAVCGVTVFGGKVCESNKRFTRLKRPSLEADGFQQSLIYSGRISNRINIGYREFSNNMARPAFNNDVEYDLNESNIIGYKGAELEIIKATNRSITYKVVRNFNLAKQ